ncbi:relaxase/mobilization nuclease domain-containing protein [Pararobbsia alpina]|uniref:MobA/VirD2-like nuclease domain-containing protein n=1 Tax=Pararobbsia alpina TaxID=621374 RepID=A0A6S7AYZ7_9BURK|nr:relaxase/mobilization nuclease domain-containing protein [Pararobbsia alpina]CAB3782178.1 hypothetical protein LMG28138_01457 [Pararobbsia alpina]
MAYPKIYIDAMLLNWGDRLFHEALRHVRAPQLSHARLGDEAARMRAQLARTLRHTPEVMIRITNIVSDGQGMGAVRQHFRYISRNGAVALEDQDGRRVVGLDALRDLTDAWQLGGWGIPEKSSRREVFNLVLSMPAGTDRRAVFDAARDFASQEFGDGRAYVFAAHDDEPHPHVHLSVQARGSDGRRLTLQKPDLQRLREHFAEELRAHGVEANATARRTRGVIRRYRNQAVVHMLAKGESTRYWRAVADDTPRHARWQAHCGVFVAWRELAHAMAMSHSLDDRKMAMQIVDFVQAMSVQQDRPYAKRPHTGLHEALERPVSDDRSNSAEPDPDIER